MRTLEQVISIICKRIHISVEEYLQHTENGEKWCRTCNGWRDRENFHIDRSRRDGLTDVCKKCNNSRVGKYKEENREEINRRARDKYFSDIERNREKVRINSAIFRKNNPERRLASVRRYLDKPEVKLERRKYALEWKKSNPIKYKLIKLRRRAADKYIDFDDDEYLKLYEHYASGDICMCCGEKKNLDAEHIIPVAVGGKTMLDNLQFLCRLCNKKKYTKTIDYRPDGGEFARQLKAQQ